MFRWLLIAALGAAGCGRAPDSQPGREQPDEDRGSPLVETAATDGKDTPKPGRDEPAPQAWKLYPTCGKTSSVLVDEARHCVWFTGDGKLGRIDMATEEVSFLADAREQGGMGAHQLALDGNRLWIAGQEGVRLEGGEGGGLGMYDIPTGSLMLYRVSNTKAGDRPGLPHNDVHRITVVGDQVWVCSGVRGWGLTRFLPRQRDPAARWTTYSRAGTETRKDAADGLLNDGVDAVVPVGDRLLVFFLRSRWYQEFDPRGPTFRNHPLVPDRPEGTEVLAKSPVGREGKIRWENFIALASFLGYEGGSVWFRGSFRGPQDWGQFDVVEAVICLDRTGGGYTLFNARATNSRAEAADGFLDFPNSMCFDGREIWMARNVVLGNADVCRYDRQSREFTHYYAGIGCGFPTFWNCARIAAGKDHLWLATDKGVARYIKKDRFPKVIASVPAAGQEGAKEVTRITATFDLPMNPSTIRANTVELFVNGALFAGKVDYDPKANGVVYTAGSRLPGGMRCELVFRSLIQATNGNPLRWTCLAFTTAE